MKNDSVTIKEVSSILSDPNAIQKDLLEAMGLVKEQLHKKYVNKIMSAVENCNTSINENPSKEIKFLKALKPFAKEGSQGQIDSCIDLMQRVYALNEVRSEFLGKANNGEVKLSSQNLEGDGSVHTDGVYDIDKSCMLNKESQSGNMNSFGGMLLVMSMMLKK